MDELVTEFLAETAEGLSVLDLQLVELEQDPENQEILSNIFRVMHTIKGTCGFLGLPRLASVAHAGENILCIIREGKLSVTPAVISLILESIDAIKSLMAGIEATGAEPEGDDSALIAKLNACAGSGEPHTLQVEEENLEDLFSDVDTPALEAADTDQPEMEEPQETVQDNFPPSPKTEKKPETAPKANAAKTQIPSQTIRVNLDVLEGLMQMVSELVLTRNQLLQAARISKDSAFTTPLQRLNHITSELQERVMKTRMQPVSNAWTPFPRLVRDLAVELGKKIELKQTGGDTELDRQLLELIKDPLTHMVRNSADHGIERPEERLAAGKPEAGTITLQAYHEGGHIIIEIRDDGKGISSHKIRQKILEKELATEKELEHMSESQILQYIFKPGFSTAEKVTSVSGRGVGMDVVKTNIEKISGTVELQSTEGKGSVFRIKIPLTLAIMPVLILESCKERFAIPQGNILEMVRTGRNSEHVIEYINDAPILRLRGKLLPLVHLAKVLGFTSGKPSGAKHFIVVCELGGFHFGLIVDRVFDTEEIVVKPVAPMLQAIEVYSGCTILGDGSVIMILDPHGLVHASGQEIAVPETDVKQQEHAREVQDKTRFMLFRTETGAPKAIPLELVSRLEEIDMANIEQTSNGPVLQYRGGLMFVTQLEENAALPTEGIHSLIVFSDQSMTMGLIVKEVLDIVEHDVSVMEKSGSDGFLGSIVIDGKTHDLINIGYFFRSRFSFLFPKQASHAPDNAQASQSQKPHILYVDDSPFFRKFIPPALIAAGYKVTTAEDPEKALAIVNGGASFSVIVTDMNMPVMSGAEFAKCCRSDLGGDIPIIALSSQTVEQIEYNEDTAALSAFVSKTNHTQLLETIAHFLSGDYAMFQTMEGAA